MNRLEGSGLIELTRRTQRMYSPGVCMLMSRFYVDSGFRSRRVPNGVENEIGTYPHQYFKS